MKKRHATAIGLTAGALAASIAHYAYWYLPRERPATASSQTLARLGEPNLESALWLPFPHQNLGVLESRVGDLRRWLALVAPPGRIAPDRLPSFGPWPLPPARELLVTERGGEIEVELDVYPTIGLLARASGRLAGNPWLSGGEVDLGRGQRGRVEWVPGGWRLTARAAIASAPTSAPIEEARSPAEVLGWLRLGRPLGWLPEGLYRLERGAESLELRSGAAAGRAVAPLASAGGPPAAWLVERPARRLVTATVIWADEGPLPPFPAAVALERGRSQRRRIPGEELLRLAGREPQRGQEAGFTLRALAASEIERGRPVARDLSELLAARPGLAVYAGLRPDALTLAARRLAEQLGGTPFGALLGAAPERLVALLGPLRGCAVSVLEVRRRPHGVRWQVCVEEPPVAAAP